MPSDELIPLCSQGGAGKIVGDADQTFDPVPCRRQQPMGGFRDCTRQRQAMADDKPSPRRGRKPPLGDKRQFLTTINPEVIRAIKQAALDLDRTASDLMEEAAKQWLARHKQKNK
jgi:hypothetical protein